MRYFVVGSFLWVDLFEDIMKLTWQGHSFLDIETSGVNVLVDPFIEGNSMNDISDEDLGPDLIAITHGHFDHVGDADKFEAKVICQPEVSEYLEEKGHEDTVGYNIGGTFNYEGVSFTMVHAFHSSGSPEDRNFDIYGGTPSGYIIDDGDTTLYHPGDTGLFGDMKDVIGDIYSPDIAAIPIGDHFTMGIDQASIAVEWLGVDEVIPIHYNTFPPIEQDPEEFEEKVKSAEVHILDVGESIEV